MLLMERDLRIMKHPSDDKGSIKRRGFTPSICLDGSETRRVEEFYNIRKVQPRSSIIGVMSLITSNACLAKAKQICGVAKDEGKLIVGDKRVTEALAKMNPPVTVLIVSDDGGCANIVAKATQLNIPTLRLATRSDVGEIVGYASVSSCVLSFEGDQELLAQLLQLG